MDGNIRLLERYHLVLSLLVLNTALVILQYCLAEKFGETGFSTLKSARLVFVGVSLAFMATQVDLKQLIRSTFFLSYSGIILFGALSLTQAYDFKFAAWRFLSFSVPVMYIVLTMEHFRSKYTLDDIRRILWQGFQLIYGSVILVYLILEDRFSGTYLHDYTKFFKHNQYGWASVLFLLFTLDILYNDSLPRWRRWLSLGLIPVALFTLLTCGNRATWLTSGLSLGLLLFKWQTERVSTKLKLGILGVLGTATFLLFLDPSSSFYAAGERTYSQLKYGTATSERLLWAENAWGDWLSHPMQWFAGRGIFNYHGLINPNGYHNSYYEVLFGCGLPVFALFFYLIFLLPLKQFWQHYSSRLLTFFPLAIIPFFESNLTGGQFIFYPWFSIMIFYALPIEAPKK